MDYPDGFPLPLITQYDYTIQTGLNRTKMTGGNVKQRRIDYTMPHIFSLSFAIKLDDLNAWHDWVSANTYTYFNIDMASFQTRTGRCSTHSVRFFTDPEYSAVDPNIIIASVKAEMIGLDSFSEVLNNTWIIAGSPASPSAPGTTSDLWHVGGTPALPSAPSPGAPSWDIAGTPAAPNSHI